MLSEAVLWLRHLVAGFTLRRYGFYPMTGHVGFVVDEVVLSPRFPLVLLSSRSILFPIIVPYSSAADTIG
jgi:hypothetical protein